MSGQSHAEAADIAGMPAAYLIRQMQYYKDGSRKEEARMGPIAKVTSEEDVKAAAEYFSKQKPRTFVNRPPFARCCALRRLSWPHSAALNAALCRPPL